MWLDQKTTCRKRGVFGIVRVVSGKKGKLSVKFFLAAALLVAVLSVALFSYFNGGKSGSASQALSVSGQSLPLPSALESSQPSPSLPAAKPLGNISFQSVKSDPSINAIIDSSQKLDNGNLLVKFHHSSSKGEPVSVIGAVRYELSKTAAKPNEEVTLTVFDWSTEYFEIKIGATSSITGFGRKVAIG